MLTDPTPLPASVHIHPGHPGPLGVCRCAEGVNFALFSEHATAVTLYLFRSKENKAWGTVVLDPKQHKTGWIWHVCLQHLDPLQMEYAYQIKGDARNPLHHFNPQTLVSDPYAIALNTPSSWAQADLGHPTHLPRSKIVLDTPFDWEGIARPRLPLKDIIIYETHVRGFTIDPSSGVSAPGTFKALVEKIPYFKELGVNAIELMPIFEFNECELHRTNPLTKKPLRNVWGYSTLNFFAPTNRYASDASWTGGIDEFRLMVKEMHRHGIEVYLDVVYNHTAEGDARGPTFSFKGIDNSVYYLLGPKGEYLNFSGTGNTFNANHPVVAQLIVDSLRYWAQHMQVDGFRFDLASCLTRDRRGIPSETPLVIQQIASDPLLADVKLIAEAWDAAGLYQVGHFPEPKRWLEWNGKYRDSVRRFIKGTDGQAGAFAQALTGSQDLYGPRGSPCHSVNFIVAHDGFTLHDLVSYQDKHNRGNGENNHDGCSNNDSWNCGIEGPSKDPQISALRSRQMRNFHVALMLSLGTPMLYMGDEYGHTKKGNNNTYCQDDQSNHFLWDHLQKEEGWLRFYKKMIHFRNHHSLLRRSHFLDSTQVLWHGLMPLQANWSGTNRFLAYTLVDASEGNSLYIAFNAQATPAQLHLPPPPSHKQWYRIVDTSLPSPEDFVDSPTQTPPLTETYSLPPYSALIAKALC